MCTLSEEFDFPLNKAIWSQQRWSNVANYKGHWSSDLRLFWNHASWPWHSNNGHSDLLLSHASLLMPTRIASPSDTSHPCLWIVGSKTLWQPRHLFMTVLTENIWNESYMGHISYNVSVHVVSYYNNYIVPCHGILTMLVRRVIMNDGAYWTWEFAHLAIIFEHSYTSTCTSIIWKADSIQGKETP